MSEKITINGIELVLVKAGVFTMGAINDVLSPDYDPNSGKIELPSHEVTLTKDYYIGVYPVTQAQWTAIMGTNPSKYQGKKYEDNKFEGLDDSRPVENVSFNDVTEFIVKLNEASGKAFRLPTEAEWEYAARGGQLSKKFKYAGSADADEVAWHRSNSGMNGSTKPVGKKACNELGLYDMSGNVWEWCADLASRYTAEPKTDPAGPASSGDPQRIIRGGSNGNMNFDCRVTARTAKKAEVKDIGVGFRLALSV